MINALIGLFLIVSSVLTKIFLINPVNWPSNIQMQITTILMNIAGSVFIVIAFLNTFLARNEIVEWAESCTENDEKHELIKERIPAMIKEYADVLTDAFPQHEKDIFQIISTANPNALAVLGSKFPEIASSEGFMKVANKIDAMNEKLNSYKLENIRSKKNIRCAYKNLFVIQAFLPKYNDCTPTEEKK